MTTILATSLRKRAEVFGRQLVCDGQASGRIWVACSFFPRPRGAVALFVVILLLSRAPAGHGKRAL